jgi:thioredoxin 1
MYKSYSELGAQPEQNRDLYSVLQISNAQHKEQLINQNRVVCVNIYADWCGPCKQTAPEYSIMAQTYTKPGLCAIVKENWDKKITTVGGIPTYQIFLDGQQVDQVVGADLKEVETKLTRYLQSVTNNSTPNYGEHNNLETSSGPAYGRNTIRNYRPQAGAQSESFGAQPYMQQSSYNQPYQYRN